MTNRSTLVTFAITLATSTTLAVAGTASANPAPQVFERTTDRAETPISIEPTTDATYQEARRGWIFEGLDGGAGRGSLEGPPPSRLPSTELASTGLEGVPALGIPVFAPNEQDPAPILFARREKQPKPPKAERPPIALSAERVQILLRSLTVPGWGQASVGKRKSATVFALGELGVWTSFTAFRVQEQLRRSSYERSARILAGIDLGGRDEEFRRIVGAYISSEEYNLLVVSRDAANLYYDDPTLYRQYIADHSLKGADTWAWPDDDALLRYRSQRKDAQRARLRANTSLALAVVNRLVSVLHAARVRGHVIPSKQSWDLETIPQDGDPTAIRLGIRTRF